MTQSTLREKILNLESELKLLKHYVIETPDFDIDEKNWQKIRPEVKKIRKKLYQKFYGKK
ncbi:MAG: hypothetical protein COT33_01095 [Candidatus Nealsonbacteria bacterium CG08_land_8_20_14_0_20_38_20]|uniref:Uncharacterized protein n=1 Tax=Candidatus Nealsonbacteria bacterium CG08_land_8_20_14_0_20_38_20 TaxID=1974705 RepID=A0A2H0YMW3_9BACT|nr:MAG: hypothetical protein COT33_01095 [Candidatus Nealsonbacteria bacterium CG08_land_8_20_14_0_20_38_20]